MSTTLRCGGCLLGALLISAALHLVLAGTLLWPGVGEVPDDPGTEQVGVSLAMFVDLGSPQAPPQTDAQPEAAAQQPDLEPVPEPDRLDAESLPSPVDPMESPPEPIPEPLLERAPTPEPTPTVAAPTPVREMRPAPKPAAKEKPKVKPKPRRTKQAKASKAKLPEAQQAAAVPNVGAERGGTGAAGAAGAAQRAAAERDYLRGLQQAIARNRFYPQGARREDRKGVVTVAFTVQSDGRLSDVRVTKGSGFDVLDQAAVETLRRLGRYKPIPPATGRNRWPVRVPIVFDLR